MKFDVIIFDDYKTLKDKKQFFSLKKAFIIYKIRYTISVTIYIWFDFLW